MNNCKKNDKAVKVVTVDTTKLFMSQKEAQKYLGVSKDWLKDRRNDGRLHYAMIGNMVFYIKSEIDCMIRDHAVTGRQAFHSAR